MSSAMIIMNKSGNVGKTTLTRHMLEANLGAQVYMIETSNHGDMSEEAKQLAGKMFADVAKIISARGTDDVPIVIDAGSSNYEVLMQKLEKIDGFVDDLDAFILPVIPKNKVQKDTCKNIEELIDLGVPASKIFVLFNIVEDTETIDEDFELVIRHQKKFKFTILDNAILSHEVISDASDLGLSIPELVNDPVSREAIAAEPDATKRLRMSTRLTQKRMAVTVNRNMRAAFEEFAAKAGIAFAKAEA